jgi:hypothetical protein|tara:strand:+ start:938 stop:1522 length:585 start_codon:yes stop_codon:yes gene_type:complete
MKHNTTQKKRTSKKKKTSSKKKETRENLFTENDYNSNDGMMTSIWGPPLWHSLHTISFNYPVQPTETQKKDYYKFFLSLENVLPCGKCRTNFKKNIIDVPFNMDVMESRYTFSKYVYDLHEHINKMLNKKSGLTYEMVRDRYEMFRARCSDKSSLEENGCIQPLAGIKTKCILRVVPKDTNVVSLDIDSKCFPK